MLAVFWVLYSVLFSTINLFTVIIPIFHKEAQAERQNNLPEVTPLQLLLVGLFYSLQPAGF